ncbi:MAG: hypothetical protein CVU42_02635 [Chloroflexi bacterium HGW-Chloroflexi-4]|jgi:murein DD-endopeptidase MepM/ murein hydrolase activator NlpD|nr:MAG: hypothetical protein CVU42_02635 [Chloroflexi bacterium HGW-Chloroflexi-4]
MDKIKSMTTPILSTNNQTLPVLNRYLISKQTELIENASFHNLFATLMSDMNSSSILYDHNSSSSEQFSAIISMLYYKLFGEQEDPATTKVGSPVGNPVNGVLTQTSHEGHVALDFGVPVGTKVKATMTGEVTFADWNTEGYGNLVIIDNGVYKAYYAHLSNIPVKKGQFVTDGAIIGLSGNTGNSTGPHLHYEIRKNGIAVNPLLSLR